MADIQTGQAIRFGGTMKYSRMISFLALGAAVGLFARGLYSDDVVRLALSVPFGAIAWLYREMNLGWDESKNAWGFLPWRQTR